MLQAFVLRVIGTKFYVSEGRKLGEDGLRWVKVDEGAGEGAGEGGWRWVKVSGSGWMWVKVGEGG